VPQDIGWRSALPGILESGNSARQPPTFDETARRRIVEKRVAEANRFPLWPLLFAVLAFLLPMGWVWAGAVVAFWGFLVHQAVQRAADVRAQLEEETEHLRHEAQSEAEHFGNVVAAANEGDAESLRVLLARWLELRPQATQRSDFRLSVDAQHGWHLDGQAIRRDEIAHVIPRLGRSGRTVNEKRRATDVDEDLAELNAAAVLSALIALFSGPTSQRVTVRVMMLDPSTGRSVPWITLACPISHPQLQRVLTPIGSAAAAIRRLGGDVGRCRNRRITAAAEPPARPAPSAPAPAVPTRSIAVPVARVTASSVESSPYGANAAAVNFHSASPEARITVTPSHAIPTAPDSGGGTSPGPVNAAPTPRNVRGEFSTVARRFAGYPGDPAARFVAFQTYYSTYAQMTSEQLRFYFKWRNAARKGELLGTDLSYIFVHVYELLHIIGAQSGFDAGEQLEKLWLTNRNAFPTLDSYLVRWTADLYATEQWNGAAIDLIQRAVTMGAACGAEDAPHWNASVSRESRRSLACRGELRGRGRTAVQRAGNPILFSRVRQPARRYFHAIALRPKAQIGGAWLDFVKDACAGRQGGVAREAR